MCSSDLENAELKAACEGLNLAEVCIVSAVDWSEPEEGAQVGTGTNFADLTIGVSEAKGEKCPRCAAVVSRLEIEL